MKGFALRLVLKQRHKRTRKWPIDSCFRMPHRVMMQAETSENTKETRVVWITAGSYPSFLSALQIDLLDEKAAQICKNLFDSSITQPWKPLESSSANSFNQSSEHTNWTLLRLLQSLLHSGIRPGRKRWHCDASCKAQLRKLAKIAWRGVFLYLLLLLKKLFGNSVQIAWQSWLERQHEQLISDRGFLMTWITQF